MIWHILRPGVRNMGHVVPQAAHTETIALVPKHDCDDGGSGPGWDVFEAHGSEHDGFEVECCSQCENTAIAESDVNATNAAIAHYESVLRRKVGWPHERKCRCTLCQRRKTCASVFVANADGTFTCPSCIPLNGDLFDRMGDDDVEVWEVGSAGWTGQPTCHICGEDIPVEIDTMIRKLTAEEVTFTLHVEVDDTPVRGNALACGDEDEDRRCEDEIIARLDNGDVWAWALVCVTATWKTWEASDYLCGCSYASEADFRADAYFSDMKAAALDALNEKIAADAEAIAELT